MEEEYAALLANQTWELVPLPPGANVLENDSLYIRANPRRVAK
jgi:hypothetical protein